MRSKKPVSLPPGVESLLSTEQAALLFNCSTQEINRLVHKPENPLPFHKVGRHFKFLSSEMIQWSKGEAQDNLQQKADRKDKATKPQRGPKPSKKVAIQ